MKNATIHPASLDPAGSCFDHPAPSRPVSTAPLEDRLGGARDSSLYNSTRSASRPSNLSSGDSCGFQMESFELPPLAAVINGQLRDLNVPYAAEDEVRMLNYTTRQGFMTYQRTLILIFLKAMESLFPNIPVIVEFSQGDGLFIRRTDHIPFDPAEIQAIEEEMHRISAAAMPIMRQDLTKAEAQDAFAARGMTDKVALFDFFPDNSYFSVYALDGVADWFNIPLLPNTRMANLFALQPYQDGLLLRIPKRLIPHEVAPFSDATTAKLHTTLRETSNWANTLGIRTAAALNQAIVDGSSNELVLISEALQEKKIANIAQEISSRPDLRLVLIAGPSSSGKTSLANRLSIQLKANGFRPLIISVDNYFVDREFSPRNPDGSYNFDTLDAIDVPAFTRDIMDLLAGKDVYLPEYNFIVGKREAGKTPVRLSEKDIIVVEGIFCLQEKLIAGLPDLETYKIYVSALGQINLDDHNYIRSTDGRLLRRIVRDNRTRGASALHTMETWESVRAGEEQNIFPYQNNADVMFNTSALYEWAVLKKYAEPLLHQIPRTSLQYPEAQRLLQLLSAFLSIDNDLIPKNSLVREFIGGSCFKV